MDMIKRFKFDVASLALYKVVQVLSTIIITRLLLQQFSVNEYAQIVILTSVSQFVLIDTGTGDSLKKIFYLERLMLTNYLQMVLSLQRFYLH